VPHDEAAVDALSELTDILDPAEPPDEPAIALAADFAVVARDLHEQPTTDLTLNRLVELAVEMVETCQDAGVAVVAGGGVTTAATTSDLVLRLDEVQGASGEGPCLDALQHFPVYRTDDLAAEPRWPSYRAEAARLGVRSVLSFRLFAERGTLGALTLYSRRPEAFDDGAFATGAIFAAHATVAFATARQADAARNLRRAVDSNRTIGMAMGILMATRGIDEDAAFDLLRGLSSTSNRKLAEIAAEVVRSAAGGPGGGMPA
jgi:GAF domain-containing protein